MFVSIHYALRSRLSSNFTFSGHAEAKSQRLLQQSRYDVDQVSKCFIQDTQRVIYS